VAYLDAGRPLNLAVEVVVDIVSGTSFSHVDHFAVAAPAGAAVGIVAHTSGIAVYGPVATGEWTWHLEVELSLGQAAE